MRPKKYNNILGHTYLSVFSEKMKILSRLEKKEHFARLFNTKLF